MRKVFHWKDLTFEVFGYAYSNGSLHKILQLTCQESGIDTSHFRKSGAKKTTKREVRECLTCGQQFECGFFKGKIPKVTCSRRCSNIVFPRRKAASVVGANGYKRICFQYHGKKCIVCDETKIVAVHHVDGNHQNVNPENLLPMCPTHHQYYHSRYRNEVEPIMTEYLKKFSESRLDKQD